MLNVNFFNSFTIQTGQLENILFNQLKLVIFDVDGTLYNQKQLRKRMFFAILGYYIIRPWRFREVLLLYHFRKERENRIGFEANNLEDEQYSWCSSKTSLSVKKMKETIDKWMFKYPNRFLKQYMYPGIPILFEELQKQNILIAVYSDYPAAKKMESMGLSADLIISSTDPMINAMKPSPKGVLYILEQLNIQQKDNCLFIGDREELDGTCARNAGVHFLLLDKTSARKDFYTLLSNRISSR